jgi:hypothetical protein
MVSIIMNPPPDTRRTGPETARPALRPRLEDPGDAPLSTDDLIGDLDPGWLAWREERAGH